MTANEIMQANAGKLGAFIKSIGNSVRPTSEARKLFPRRPKGYVRAAKDLKYLAENLRAESYCRTRGDKAGANIYRLIADKIYLRLPLYAR